MNKTQLIEKIADRTNQPKQRVEQIINSFVDVVKTSVKKGDDAKIIGFGTFTKQKHRSKMGHNPQTKAPVHIPSRWLPKFRAGQEFKALVK